MKVLILLLICFIVSVTPKCGHIENKRVVRSPVPYASSPPANVNNSQPIRITVDTSNLDSSSTTNKKYTCFNVGDTVTIVGSPDISYTCASADVFTSAKMDYLVNTLIPAAMTILQETLAVIPVQGNLILPSTSCRSDTTFDSKYVSTGSPNTDLVLFVTAHPIYSSTNTQHNILAQGLPCYVDNNYRPIAGILNFDPYSISTDDNLYQQHLYTTVHESTHVLGFNNNTFTALDMISTDTDNHYANDATAADFKIMSTPNVVAYVQNYFGCSGLKGAAMEDGGGSGTALVHWEKRLFMNEYMSGSASHNPVFSGLTLAFFADTGFYYVNHTHEQQLLWGRNKGCDWVQKSCQHWSSPYFCSNNGDYMCSADLQTKSLCSYATYSTNIDPDYQYFSTATQGGYDTLADYCPYALPVNNDYSCIDTGSPTSTISNGEEFGDGSRCFSSTVILNLATGSLKSQNVCYKTYCISENALKVKLNSIWYDCPSGQSIEVIKYSGKITCPDPYVICAGQPTDNSWPVWKQVIPASGEPGTTVTIYGSKFTNGSVVTTSGGPCSNQQILSDQVIVVTLPNYDDIDNPSSLLKLTLSIVVTDTQGRTAVGYHAFGIEIVLNANLLSAAGTWIKEHWYVVLIAAVVLIALIYAIYRCCREKDPTKEYSRRSKA